MLNSIEDLLGSVKNDDRKKIAIAAAEDENILEVVNASLKHGLSDFILIGDKEKISKIIEENGYKIDSEIIHQSDHKSAAETAVKLVKEKKAEALMKGFLHTSILFKAVLDKENGLNKGNIISQVSVFDKVDSNGVQLLTDCALSIEPNLMDKKHIIENAVILAKKLGYDTPRVALLSAVELVNPTMQDTIDAAVLCKMADRGQIKGCVIDGPLALDNAISMNAAKSKKINSRVAGNADILIAPNLQVANVLSKSLVYFANKKVAAAIMGASAPIISTSRSESLENRLLSIALAIYISSI